MDKRTSERGDNAPKPDPETLNTTDPQEHMSGPFSSSMQKAGEPFDTDETKEEADEEKEKIYKNITVPQACVLLQEYQCPCLTHL